MTVLVSNMQTEVTLDEELADLLTAAIGSILRWVGYNEEAEVSLVFVNDQYIQELNYQYRQINQPTDVLSFSMMEGEAQEAPPGGEILLGDIVISLPTAARQAAEYGHSFYREVAYLAIHGTLHLLGYDHINDADKQVMREKEEEFLKKLNLSR